MADRLTEGRTEAIAISPSLFLRKTWGQIFRMTRYNKKSKWDEDP